MPELARQSLLIMAESILRQSGAAQAPAQCVAEALVEGDRSGHPSHGLIRLPQYVEAINTGQLDPAAEPETLRQTPVTAVVDGHRGFGQVTACHAVEVAMELVQSLGLAAVSVANTYHIGRLGDYPERAARRGLIGIAWANGLRSPACVAPFGGIRGALGTNPFAVAVPRPHEAAPIVVDFATCKMAEGKVRIARNRGESVPAGVILDAEGNASTDPNDFYAGGSLLPTGDHKGYGLGIACDLLAGLLSGSGTPCMPDYAGSNSILLILVNPECFRPRDDFLRDVQQFCEIVTATDPAPGVERVQMPGDPEIASRERNRNLIAIEPSTWNELVATAGRVGVEIPTVES